MQNDAFRKLTDVFSNPGSFLHKTKKFKKNSVTVGSNVLIDKCVIIPSTESINQHLSFSPLSDVIKSAPVTDEEKQQFLTVHTTGTAKLDGELPSSHSSKSPLKSPFHSINQNIIHVGTGLASPGVSKVFAKEVPPLVHYPFSISSMDQFSPQRRAWLQNCLSPNGVTNMGEGAGAALNSSVLKSESAWDTAEDQLFSKSVAAYGNPNEATGLLFVKLMQVTNRATSKLFDVEWSLRIGNVERTSYPARSFKDNPGNTATMNEVFLFDVNEPFRLEMSVTGNPVPTKFGTMAGFSNSQTAQLGYLDLNFCMDPMERSVKTYRLCRPVGEDAKGKADCEVVVMIGLHVLEEPVEDRSWETDTLYQGFLTVMVRGGRVASWKRYWAVLEGRALKLYDAEYQLKRDAITVIPLAHVSRVQLPDYEKVDVGSNGFSMVVKSQGVDFKSNRSIESSELDYCIYAFTDSSHFHEVWLAHLEEAVEQYQENMHRRREMQIAKMNRRATQALSRHSFETSSTNSAPMTPVDGLDEEDERMELIDVRFVW
ncbi:hypothetical protein FBU30_001992 [Linnemannia zychae]|nr:hypothetical protein FBU30_001992 [Linnemannia zychae]